MIFYVRYFSSCKPRCIHSRQSVLLAMRKRSIISVIQFLTLPTIALWSRYVYPQRQKRRTTAKSKPPIVYKVADCTTKRNTERGLQRGVTHAEREFKRYRSNAYSRAEK